MTQAPPEAQKPRHAGANGVRAADAGTDQGSLTSGRLLAVFGPVLALVVSTVVLALAASWLDWHRSEMLVAAAGAGGVIAVLATILLYRQAAARQAARRALHEAEARVVAVVESAMDPIITVDEAQRVVLFNAAAEQVFGWPRAAIIGQALDMLLPQRFHASHRAHIEGFGETGITSRRMGAQTVLRAIRASGEEFPIEASISQHTEGSRKFFTVILRDVSARVRADEALRQSKEELQQLASAAHSTREHEQNRIARELHDELGQSLTALKMLAASARSAVTREPAAATDKLAKMETLLDGTVAATRRIASELRPLMLDDLGLIPAVEWLVEGFTQRTGIPCKLTVEDPELALEHTHATAIFRILQESLTNVARHARATRVDVAVSQDDSRVTIRVRDDGVGFSIDAPRAPASRGLLGIRERAHLLGGELALTSAPGSGTIIEVRLPIAPEAPRP